MFTACMRAVLMVFAVVSAICYASIQMELHWITKVISDKLAHLHGSWSMTIPIYIGSTMYIRIPCCRIYLSNVGDRLCLLLLDLIFEYNRFSVQFHGSSYFTIYTWWPWGTSWLQHTRKMFATCSRTTSQVAVSIMGNPGISIMANRGITTYLQ